MVKLTNMMEEILLERIDEILPDLQFCTCDVCKTDIATYALNRLPPKYVHTECGSLLCKLELMNAHLSMKITTTIIEGANLVNEKPNHEPIAMKDRDFSSYKVKQ